MESVEERVAGGGGATVAEALEELRAGRFIVLVDPQRGGQLAMAGELATPEAVNFMCREARGLVCLALDERRCDELGLPPISRASSPAPAAQSPAFALSIEARTGTSTGISAADRALTLKVASDPFCLAAELVSPGHIFPVRAAKGGVLARRGHAEAAVDVVRLAGFTAAAVTCDVLDADGAVADGAWLVDWSARNRLRLLSIGELRAYRSLTTGKLERVASCELPTRHGDFTAVGYLDRATGAEHVALLAGDLRGAAPLVRLHRGCRFGDALGSIHCGCGSNLDRALEMISRAGSGALVYLAGDAHEDELDGRATHVGCQILAELGLSRIDLLTEDPWEAVLVADHGLSVSTAIALGRTQAEPTGESALPTPEPELLPAR